jgi:hypothetical protein
MLTVSRLTNDVDLLNWYSSQQWPSNFSKTSSALINARIRVTDKRSRIYNKIWGRINLHTPCTQKVMSKCALKFSWAKTICIIMRFEHSSKSVYDVKLWSKFSKTSSWALVDSRIRVTINLHAACTQKVMSKCALTHCPRSTILSWPRGVTWTDYC